MNKSHLLYGTKILIVEDNPINIAILKSCLNHLGCVFLEVNNGEKAIELLENQKVDVIMMDIQMPGMDGVETTKIIREVLKSTTPIIALTANLDKKQIENFFTVGMNSYIIKPFDSEKIISIVTEILPNNNNEIMTEPNTQEKKYSLHYLIQITHGDRVLINEIIDLFCEHIPKEVEQIKGAFQNQNIEQLKRLIHKIKPNINNFKIEKLYEIISLLDNLSEVDDLKSSATAESISILENIIREVVEDLKINKLN